jgi:hypothetical protein
VKREYTLPTFSPAKRAAASAALRAVKLDVAKIGSECSSSAVGRRPARTDRVANPQFVSSLSLMSHLDRVSTCPVEISGAENKKPAQAAAQRVVSL